MLEREKLLQPGLKFNTEATCICVCVKLPVRMRGMDARADGVFRNTSVRHLLCDSDCVGNYDTTNRTSQKSV